MVKTRQSILTAYLNQVQIQQAHIDALKKKLNSISLSRLGLFITEIVLVALVISQGYHWAIGLLMIVPVVLFLALVKKQATVTEHLDYAMQLLWVYQNEADLMQGRSNGYANGEEFEDEQHPYASDLDIYGPGSLFAYLNRCSTVKGRELLATNLGRPNERVAIIARQEAITELAGHMEDTFHFRARIHNHKPEQLKAIEAALDHTLGLQLAFTRNKLMRLYITIVPFLMLALLLLGIVYGGLTWNIFGLAALFNAGITFYNLQKVNLVYNSFTGSANLLRSFSGSIAWTEQIEWQSPYLKGFFEKPEDSRPLSRQIRELSTIIHSFDARLNMIVAMVLTVFLVWDLRCSIKLEKWHSKSSDQLLKGLFRISQFEELISFATLKINEPSWTFPEIKEEFSLNAKALGHPLIVEQKRVVNDFELDAKPTVDIVTGSNMAGKSTFLRTVGINMVLAFAGSTVCAEQLSLSIFEALSYMRIKDSLNDQTSTFKAELNRLKMILDATKKSNRSFVLIDEMLRGTNSKDKYLGSKVFIEKMIEQHTPALFATHDLQLSEMKDDYQEQVRNYHFDIQIKEGEMNFDYKLKHGACKTFNAAILLKQIGLALNQEV